MIRTRSNAAAHRMDQSLAEAETAFSQPLPSAADMRLAADHIAERGALMDADFAARLDYGQVRTAAQSLTLVATERAAAAETAVRRLRRRLFWQLIWARYQGVFWVLLGLGILGTLGWTVWQWRAEIIAFLTPTPPPSVQPFPGQPLPQGPGSGVWGPQ